MEGEGTSNVIWSGIISVQCIRKRKEAEVAVSRKTHVNEKVKNEVDANLNALGKCEMIENAMEGYSQDFYCSSSEQF